MVLQGELEQWLLLELAWRYGSAAENVTNQQSSLPQLARVPTRIQKQTSNYITTAKCLRLPLNPKMESTKSRLAKRSLRCPIKVPTHSRKERMHQANIRKFQAPACMLSRQSTRRAGGRMSQKWVANLTYRKSTADQASLKCLTTLADHLFPKCRQIQDDINLNSRGIQIKCMRWHRDSNSSNISYSRMRLRVIIMQGRFMRCIAQIQGEKIFF